ncbi:glycosyltransferase [Paracoccus sp. (in: a-proteobacteria)]|uniref:rhamnosyltransferase WsaF family glycosyltransferase n=1 Tax=Paracoccus sp. TaxID=267 RepID=UPI0035AED562
MHIRIILAVFNSDENYLDQQLRSIAEQTHRDLSLTLVNADGKSADLASDLARRHGLAFRVVESPATPLNSYAAFELGAQDIARSFQDKDYLVALCDQDDIWEPTKLEDLSRAIAQPGVSLVHSDASLIDANNALLCNSMFRKERRLKTTRTRTLLYVNNVTGMTTLFRKDVMEAALPFPRQAALYFHHDLWIALVASALGRVVLVDKPLVRYRQHGANVVGAIMAPQSTRRPFDLATAARNALNSYYVAAYLAKMLYLRCEELTSQGMTIDRKSLNDLRPYLRGSHGYHRFLADAVRILPLSYPTAWQAASRWVGGAARQYLINRKKIAAAREQAAGFDSLRFSIAPGATPGYMRMPDPAPDRHRPVVPSESFLDARRILKWESHVSPDAPTRINVLIPSLNPSEMFAGLATAIEVGVAMAEAGAAVRFVTTDAPVASYAASRDFVAKRTSGKEAMANLSLVDGVSERVIDFSPDDRFVATAWWTAHLANDMLATGRFRHARFTYLIQDYEPNFYAWGDAYAAARNSYDMNFIPLINSSFLADYLDMIGVLKLDNRRLVFRPNINLDRYGNVPRRPHKGRLVAIYGRPEVERNMFPLAIAGLNGFIKGQAPDRLDETDFISIGMDHAPVALSDGRILRSAGKIPWDEYPDFLGGIDVGLALMYSPHPSHLPLEMAAAGIMTVTNRFEGKDLSHVSDHIISCDVTTSSVVGALQAAMDRATGDGANRPSRQVRADLLGGPLPDAAREALKEMGLGS